MRRVICAAAVLALGMPVMAQDKAADVMEKTRAALGGARLEQIKALSLEGPFAREAGNRQVQGQIELTLQLPGNMHKSEDTEMMGGMSLERVQVLAGDTSWEDTQNRGGMGGNMQIVMRGPGNQELNAEQLEQARLRRMKTEFNRYLLAFLGGAGLQPTYVAVAEAPEGKADVVEVKNEQGQAVRLFIDQATSMPLMLQYQEVRPRMSFMGGPGGPGGGRRGPGPPGAPRAGAADPEEIRRRMENAPPPQPSTVTLYLGEYKQVDGVMLPHRLTQAVDGKTVEEWTIERARLNPNVKADLFEKK
ncbi:MAG TPA: hypothetical protein VMO26_15090 [Vicinamibacterales bacterium]|nr:hypothetical protein [Vicinamibacterales bacterium]